MTLNSLYAERGPLIMGVVNITPDSFSDGGRYFDPQAAIDHALKLVADGADVLDIGAESTRPGAEPVSTSDELKRLLPVISKVSELIHVPISVDTLKSEVAHEAIQAGAKIWNDVSALSYDSNSLEMAANLGCDVILMHMKGQPRTMQHNPTYGDVVAEVEAYLLERAHLAMKTGITPSRIWLDPGIGFGKSLDHNLALIAATDRLVSHQFSILMAASRKRFVSALEAREGAAESAADNRLGGTIAVHLKAISKGAKMVRVHDVFDMKQALRLWRAV